MTVPDTFRVLLTYEEPITETSFYGMWRCYINEIKGWHAHHSKLVDCCWDAGHEIDRFAEKGSLPRGPQGDTIEPIKDDTPRGNVIARIALRRLPGIWEATVDCDPRWLGRGVDAQHALGEAAWVIQVHHKVKDSTMAGRPSALTSEDRQAIVERRAAGESAGVLAEAFGVHRNTIGAVVSLAKAGFLEHGSVPPPEPQRVRKSISTSNNREGAWARAQTSQPESKKEETEKSKNAADEREAVEVPPAPVEKDAPIDYSTPADPSVSTEDRVEQAFLMLIADQEEEERRLRREIDQRKKKLAEAVRLTQSIKSTLRAYREKHGGGGS